MGSFIGHAIPGTMFLLFGVWWAIQISTRYFTSKKRKQRFTASVTYPCPSLCCGCSKKPLEAIIKVALPSVGFLIEVIGGLVNGGLYFHSAAQLQHSTMYFGFMLSGIIDIMCHYKVSLPKDADYAFLSLAIFVEGILFKFHLHGRNEMDVLVHTFLVYLIAAGVLVLLAEIKWRHNILLSLCRPVLTLLQGMWFWQVAFILYNPARASAWEGSHTNLMSTTALFTWHCTASLLINVVIFVLIGRCTKGSAGYGDKCTREIDINHESQTTTLIEDDSQLSS